jgi:hypothetical protein
VSGALRRQSTHRSRSEGIGFLPEPADPFLTAPSFSGAGGRAGCCALDPSTERSAFLPCSNGVTIDFQYLFPTIGVNASAFGTAMAALHNLYP